MTAVLALYELLAGAEGAQVVVVATDERQAGLCHRIASRMVELHPALEQRVQQYADQLTVPRAGPHSRSYLLSRSGWRGWTSPWPSLTRPGASTKRSMRSSPWPPASNKSSVVLAIGTPGPELEQTILGRLRTHVIDYPDDPPWYGESIPPPGSRTTRWTASIVGS